MTPPPPVLALSRLALCLDCEAVYALRLAACPACGSRAAHTLAKWLSDSERGQR